MEIQTGHATHEGGEQRRNVALLALFAVVLCLAAIDLLSDIGEGVGVAHGLLEGALFGVGVVGVVATARALLRLRRRAARLEAETRSLSARLRDQADASEELRGELLRAAADAERWRAEAGELLAGLSRAIDAQFEAWALSNAEREVALLLLKGLSHKEIAELRDTSDATTRQQARAVYKKAGLTGRNDLSAFFLEDLLAPTHERQTRGVLADGQVAQRAPSREA